jgi:hypothetical protein
MSNRRRTRGCHSSCLNKAFCRHAHITSTEAHVYCQSSSCDNTTIMLLLAASFPKADPSLHDAHFMYTFVEYTRAVEQSVVEDPLELIAIKSRISQATALTVDGRVRCFALMENPAP